MSNWLKELENAGLIRSGRLIFYASDIPSWLGHSHFASPSSLLERKLRGEKVPETDKMRLGKEIEGHLIEVTAKKTGVRLVDREKWQTFFSKDFSEYKGIKIGLGGKVDALGERIEIIGEDILRYEYVIEVKHMGSYAVQEIEKEIPSWYLDQILAYAYLHQKGVIFGALCKNDYVTKINEYYELESGIQKMLEGLNEMARLIIDGDRDGIEKFYQRVKSENTTKAPKKVFFANNLQNSNKQLDSLLRELRDLHIQYKNTILEYKAFEEREKALKEKIKQVANEYGIYIYDDYVFKIEEAIFEKFNTKLLKEENPDLYLRYVDTIKYKKITTSERSKEEAGLEDDDLDFGF